LIVVNKGGENVICVIVINQIILFPRIVQVGSRTPDIGSSVSAAT